MKETLKIKVNQEKVTYIESLEYEKKARQDIIIRIIQMQDGTENTETFKKYQKELFEQSYALEIAKGELEKEFTPKKWVGHNVRWNLDYSTGIFTASKLCEC